MQDIQPPTQADIIAVRELVEGVRMARAVQVATVLGIPDLLASGPRPAGDLATEVSSDEGALYRLLRALANRDLLVEEDGGFRLTPRGSLLRDGVPGSLRDWTLWHGSQWSLAAWDEFEHSVRTGEPAFDRATGMPFFEFLSSNADMAAAFSAAMVSISDDMDRTVLDAFDFSPYRVVADIGGGRGALLARLAGRYPTMRGILFDLPRVAASAAPFLEQAGVTDRIQCVGGDFFAGVPAGADLYVLKAIIHDWRDRQARDLLRRCREAITPEGTLMVIDAVVPGPGKASMAKEADLQMLAMQTGRERTEPELRGLLTDAGFALREVRPTASPLSISIAAPG